MQIVRVIDVSILLADLEGPNNSAFINSTLNEIRQFFFPSFLVYGCSVNVIKNAVPEQTVSCSHPVIHWVARLFDKSENLLALVLEDGVGSADLAPVHLLNYTTNGKDVSLFEDVNHLLMPSFQQNLVTKKESEIRAIYEFPTTFYCMYQTSLLSIKRKIHLVNTGS